MPRRLFTTYSMLGRNSHTPSALQPEPELKQADFSFDGD
jgi:hypothetical protein